MVVTKHLKIYGKVQGVFFRESMSRKANELGITGWVRNRSDGAVEAMVKGSSDAVATIIEWAHRGPEDANVEQVVSNPGSGTFSDFEKRPSV